MTLPQHEARRVSRRSCSGRARTRRIPPRWSPTTPLLMKFARERRNDRHAVRPDRDDAARASCRIPITLAAPADRVTDENASVRVLDPGRRCSSTPNKIGEADFAHWVQERSLYMPHTFDPQYRARVLDERQGRSAERRRGARRAGGEGDVRLHDVLVLPAASGGQSGRGAVVHQPSVGATSERRIGRHIRRLDSVRP